MANVRLAIRTLIKTPFIAFVAILSLALGIGATSAIFSLFNQLLLRPLPVPEPARLINLGAPGPKPGSTSCNQSGNCDRVFSFPMFRDLERAQTVFTGIAAHRVVGASTREIGLRIELGASPSRVRAMILRQVATMPSSVARSD
jgi:hypothetical protein